jgi:hypothetical protein
MFLDRTATGFTLTPAHVPHLYLEVLVSPTGGPTVARWRRIDGRVLGRVAVGAA